MHLKKILRLICQQIIPITIEPTMQKRWEFIEYDVAEAIDLQQQLKIKPIFCQLLVQRGIRTYDEAKRFFRPQLSHLHDPFLMKDMEKAVRRIAEAIIKKQRILIYGDYDVDGTTAVSLMYSFFADYHEQLDYYIPDRYKEGYGVSIKGIEYAIQQQCALIISLDCGIKDIEAVQFAEEKNIDFIICDHHIPDENLPNAYAILNPKQKDCSYPYKELSGCAIGFKLVEAFAQYYNISFDDKVVPLLDLVVVSLACDFVPLTGENRVLATFGLEQLNSRSRLGFQTLMHLLNKEEAYDIRDIVFGIGPHINAVGRIEHASIAVQLLITKEESIATDLAQTLISTNQERRDIEHEMVQQAHELVQNDITFAEKKALVLFDERWHKGVVGIVASKMVDAYYKPSIILTESNGRIVGSARSVHGFDIYKALEQCSDLLINYGGHPFAAGMTLKPSKLEDFIVRFQLVVSQMINPLQEEPIQYVSAELNFNLIDANFWNLLYQFAPFGPQNMRPVFSTKQVTDTGYSKVVKEKHLKLVVQQQNSSPIEGIAFGLGQHWDNITALKPFEMCYVLEENTFKGQSKLQLNVRDIRFRS